MIIVILAPLGKFDSIRKVSANPRRVGVKLLWKTKNQLIYPDWAKFTTVVESLLNDFMGGNGKSK
jgi:hypothetical protein